MEDDILIFLHLSRFKKLIKWKEGDLSLSSELQLSSLESSGGSQPLLGRGLAIMNCTTINALQCCHFII